MREISVILPTFNRREYVDEAITSVLEQQDCDFELVVVDDCSTDGTLQHVHQRYGSDPRVRVLKTLKNGGPSAAKNHAIRSCASPLVTLLCDDDAFRPGALAAATDLMGARPDISFAWFAVAVYEQLLQPAHLLHESFKNVPLIHDRAQREVAWSRDNPGDGHLLVVRRHCYAEVGGYADELRAAEDTDLLLRLMRRYDYACDPRVFVNVRLHDRGQTARDTELRTAMYLRLLERQGHEFQQVPRAHANWLVGGAVKLHESGRQEEARRLFLRALRLAPVETRTWLHWASAERRWARDRSDRHRHTR